MIDPSASLTGTTATGTVRYQDGSTFVNYTPATTTNFSTWTICCCSCHARQETIEDLVSRLREKLHQEKRVKGEARALIDDLKTFLRD